MDPTPTHGAIFQPGPVGGLRPAVGTQQPTCYSVGHDQPTATHAPLIHEVQLKRWVDQHKKILNVDLMATADGDDRMNVELRENATAAADAAVSGKERIPQCPGNIPRT